ncbi:MAG: GNAT family N-acetyltransferase [Clostridia bacterium]|nr:GNAT family N-acetyltransferase [Clostridia bacterium]
MILPDLLETQNLILKKASIMFAESAHKNIFVFEECAKHMLWRVSKTLEETTSKIDKWCDLFKDGLAYFIFEKDGNPLNVCGFIFALKTNNEISDIGLCFGKDYFGKGYGKQVMQLLITQLQNKGITRIEYSCFSNNIGSNKLAKSLGFRYYKTQDRFVNKLNKYVPENFYDIMFK